MSIQEVVPEQLAELLHHYHQALDPEHSASAQRNCELWDQLSAQEKNRLIAAARLALLELAATGQEREEAKRHFAKPGTAEWGC